MHPLLGFIPPSQRTQAQNDAHELAARSMVKFSLPVPTFAKGQAVRLFDFWKAAEVVADVGLTFNRFRQLTGACVGVGGGNASFSTIAAQRMASDSPTKAFLPFWLAPYGMSRHYMGDDGQGQGSMGATFAKALTTDGIRDWAQDGNLPKYSTTDGIAVTSQIEMQWSSVRNSALAEVLTVSRQHLFGSAAECRTTDDIKAMIANGYGVSFACNNYIGDASIQGSGSNAALVGYWDTQGPHQQSVHAYWEHPSLGGLFWAQNSWAGRTYQSDPAGGPVCGCWVTEKNVTAAMRLDAEVYGLSHLNWFPAQPRVLDWVV